MTDFAVANVHSRHTNTGLLSILESRPMIVTVNSCRRAKDSVDLEWQQRPNSPSKLYIVQKNVVQS